MSVSMCIQIDSLFHHTMREKERENMQFSIQNVSFEIPLGMLSIFLSLFVAFFPSIFYILWTIN